LGHASCSWLPRLPNLPDRLGDRDPLRNKDIDLPQLYDDLFRHMLLPWHVLILLDAIRHTSSRTTSVGVDHIEKLILKEAAQGPEGQRQQNF